MTGWNLPPGVTGQEYEIAGADREWDAPAYCGQGCGGTVTFHMESYGAEYWGIDDAGHEIEGEYALESE